MDTTTVATPGLADVSEQLAAVSAQLHALTGQVAYLTEQARMAEQSRESWEDLQADAQPILRDMYDMTVEQLLEIEESVQLEDVIRLLKRLAGHTRTFEGLLEQLDSATDFLADAGPIVNEVYDTSVGQLALAERKGYFGFARQIAYIADRIVTSFSEEEVQQLGDNIVHILRAVKSLTQPEIMTLVGNLGSNLQEAERHRDELPTGAFALLRQMRDPEVRRGFAVTLAALKAAGKE